MYLILNIEKWSKYTLLGSNSTYIPIEKENINIQLKKYLCRHLYQMGWIIDIFSSLTHLPYGITTEQLEMK